MDSIMLINVLEEEEVRVAILEDGKLVDLYLERSNRENIVGNIYKAQVVNIAASLEAAFVEFGYRRHGFLHVSNVKPSLGGRNNNSHRNGRGIRSMLSPGQSLLVQVTKEGIGDKGPALTTYLSLPGRFLVLMPGLSRRGVSRKITDEDERRRLRSLLRGFEAPGDVGLIVRTAGQGKEARALERDKDYLLRLWNVITERANRSDTPAMVYQESDQVIRVIRDVFNEDIRNIIIDGEGVYNKVREFLRVVMPRHVRKAKLYTDTEPLFHNYGVEKELDMIHSRTCPLKCGGSIVLEQTEALVAIDVNSGQYKGKADAEETAFRTNLEAAPEIARQIRLRDLGGLVIVDFIDMEGQDHRAKVERAFWGALKNDRARLRMLRMSPFCVVEMTRQRRRASLSQSTYAECPSCRGRGSVKSPQTLGLEILRRIKANIQCKDLARVEVAIAPEVANYLNNYMRSRINELQRTTNKEIVIAADANCRPDEHDIRFLNGDGKRIRP